MLIDSGICPWCDTRLLDKEPKRTNKTNGLSDDELREFHRRHVEESLSVRELGRIVHGRGRYRSPTSAAEAIRYGWRRLSLPPREQATATAKANRDRAHPDSPGTEDRAAYKRWLRAKHREEGRPLT